MEDPKLCTLGPHAHAVIERYTRSGKTDDQEPMEIVGLTLVVQLHAVRATLHMDEARELAAVLAEVAA